MSDLKNGKTEERGQSSGLNRPVTLCLMVLAALLLVVLLEGLVAFRSPGLGSSWKHHGKNESVEGEGRVIAGGSYSFFERGNIAVRDFVSSVKGFLVGQFGSILKWQSGDCLKGVELPFRNDFKFVEMSFNSEFESGNLKFVRKMRRDHYRLKIGSDRVLNEDDSEKKNWFFFKVYDVKRSRSVRLSIGTMNRNWSMWKHGLLPVYKSSLHGGKWKIYDMTETKLIMKKQGLWLEFEYPFQEGEEVYFALTFPYTTQRLSRYLDKIEDRIRRVGGQLAMHRNTLIRSNLGQPVEMLWVGSTENRTSERMSRLKNLFPDGESTVPYLFKNNCNVVVSARVHPSETASSYLLEGFLNHILRKGKIEPDLTKKSSADLDAETGEDYFSMLRSWIWPKPKSKINLRRDMSAFLKRCNLIIIPMLNPDGVKLGRTRTDSNGINLNNYYRQADLTTPSIYALKKFIRYYNQEHQVTFFFDLHSHFTRRGAFLFGNPLKPKSYQRVLMFPYIFHKFEKEFSVRKSSFGSDKAESTSRKEISRFARLKRVYTIEVNYWGNKRRMSHLKKNKKINYNLRKVRSSEGFYDLVDFRRMGANLAESVVEFFRLRRKSRASDRAKIERRAERFFRRYKDWRYGKDAAEKKRLLRKKNRDKMRNGRIVTNKNLKDKKSAKNEFENMKNIKNIQNIENEISQQNTKKNIGNVTSLKKNMVNREPNNNSNDDSDPIDEILPEKDTFADVPFALNDPSRKFPTIQIKKMNQYSREIDSNFQKSKVAGDKNNIYEKKLSPQKKKNKQKNRNKKSKPKIRKRKRKRKIKIKPNPKNSKNQENKGYNMVQMFPTPSPYLDSAPLLDNDHPDSEFCKGAFTFSQCLKDLKNSEKSEQASATRRDKLDWEKSAFDSSSLSSFKNEIFERSSREKGSEVSDKRRFESQSSLKSSQFPIWDEGIQISDKDNLNNGVNSILGEIFG